MGLSWGNKRISINNNNTNKVDNLKKYTFITLKKFIAKTYINTIK
jgi:hypothetical protein